MSGVFNSIFYMKETFFLFLHPKTWSNDISISHRWDYAYANDMQMMLCRVNLVSLAQYMVISAMRRGCDAWTYNLSLWREFGAFSGECLGWILRKVLCTRPLVFKSCLIDFKQLKVNGWCTCLLFVYLCSALDCFKEWIWMRKKASGVMKITDPL